jgi:hypothetical protein
MTSRASPTGVFSLLFCAPHPKLAGYIDLFGVMGAILDLRRFVGPQSVVLGKQQSKNCGDL